MKYLLAGLLGLLSVFVHGQIVFKGQVVNEENNPVNYATVSVENPVTKVVLAYELVNEKGNFEIALKTDLDEVNIRVTAINYAVFNQLIKSDSQELILELKAEATQLEEIFVKASVITQRNDTIVFDLDAFAGKNDRVLEDVLKKMPGIEVGLGGQITYQGKPINKFYVEGKDLMGGKYTSITKALPNMHVSKLEVLENHQPIKMLQNKVASENPAINIRLKQNISFSGSGKVGVGGNPFLWKSSVSPMLFSKELQYLINYETNNTGDDVASKLNNYGVFSSFDIYTYHKATGNELAIAETALPSISSTRYLFNKSHLISGNVLTNLSKELELKINAYYYNDENERTGEQYTEVKNAFDGENEGKVIRYGRKNNSFRFSENFKTYLTLTKNTENNYLKNVLLLSVQKQKSRGNLLLNDNSLAQSVMSPSFDIQNSISTLIPVGNNKFANFKSIIDFTRDRQNYGVNATDILNFPDESINQYIGMEQTYTDNTFYTQNALSMSWKIKKWTLTEEYSVLYENSKIETDLYGFEAQRIQIGGLYQNDLNYSKFSNVANTSLNYKGVKWDLNIGLPVYWVAISLKDNTSNAKKTVNRAVFQPSFYTSYKLSHMLTLRGYANVKTDFTPLNQLYPHYIFSGLNFTAYQSKIEDSKSYTSGLRFEFKNPFNGIFINGGTSYSIVKNNLLYGSQIDENGQQIIEALEQKNETVSQTANINVGKFFSEFSTNVKGSFGVNKNKADVLLNQMLRKVKMYHYTYGFQVTNNHFDWLNFTYDFSYRQSQRKDFNRNTNTYSGSHNARIDAFPIKNHSLVWKLDYQENRFNHQAFANRFMDLMYRFKWDKKKIDFEIEWQNILNTKEYEEVIINNIQTSTTWFKLRPTQVLFSVRFNF
ncbi:peptidase associated domain and porin domain-containing protein [Myroides indicus]|uniref:Carboxypeptidase-like protein n=1 Tax=Myroides indicus TaxID=1323422 RepID=A0A4V3E7Z0_9FLAO|nr:TonB-dependent receptor [Myroides indicus]TDS54603.1 hypothetical protein C8P70_12546 [Myroides indicus]